MLIKHNNKVYIVRDTKVRVTIGNNHYLVCHITKTGRGVTKNWYLQLVFIFENTRI